MTDIVERLRGKVPMAWEDEGFMSADEDAILATFKEAADEIERLREELYECARYLEEQVSASYWHIEQPFDANTQRRYARDMARAHKAFAALGEKE